MMSLSVVNEAQVIDGKAYAAALRARVAVQAAAFAAQTGRKAGLSVVLVGENPASEVYVRNKATQTQAAGMGSAVHKLPADTALQTLLALIEHLNADPAINGILVQLPLPAHIDAQAVIETIDPAKDVDGLTAVSTGRLALGLPGLVPCTPLGCLMLLKDQLGDLSGMAAVVIGRSILVGKPMAQLLLRENCTVTVAHSHTRDLPAVVRGADIVVAAVGRREMVQANWMRPGATVIDVGINRVDIGGGKTRLVGDVDYMGAARIAAAITPVPGGVGPMTIAVLLRNTLVAAYAQAGLPLLAELM